MVQRDGERMEIAADAVQLGDKIIYLPEDSEGNIVFTLEEVQSIEAIEQKRSDFIEMHTTTYTVIVDGILSHCSSTNDVALLRPLEKIFGKICPHAMNKVYTYVKGF